MDRFLYGLQGWSPIEAIIYAGPINQFFYLILIATLILMAGLSLVGVKAGMARRIIGLFVAFLGALATVFQAMSIQAAAKATGTTDIAIMTPSIMDVVTLGGLSLIVLAMALTARSR